MEDEEDYHSQSHVARTWELESNFGEISKKIVVEVIFGNVVLGETSFIWNLPVDWNTYSHGKSKSLHHHHGKC